MARASLAVLLAVGLVVSAASAERCTSCKAVMSSLRGVLGAQEANPALVDLAQRTLCGKHAGCSKMLASLVPEITEWLRDPDTTNQLCAGPDVCGSTHDVTSTVLGRLLAVRQQVQNEVVCGMCQSVVNSLQMELELGERMESFTLWTRAQEECGRMAQGELAAACSRVVDLYYEELAQVMHNARTSYSVCASVGLCTRQMLDGFRAPPLDGRLVDALAQVVQRVEQQEPLRADMCDMCKLTVVEVHTLLANPTVQQQVLNYTKSLCDSLSGASADTCKFDVDIYGPAVFVLLNQYLQPDPICAAVHMCSNATASAAATTASTQQRPQQQPQREWSRGSMALLPGATRGGAAGGSLLLRGHAAGAAAMQRQRQQQQQQQQQGGDMARFLDVWVGRGKAHKPSAAYAPLDADHRGEQQQPRSWVVEPGPGEKWTEQGTQVAGSSIRRGVVPSDEDDYPPYAYYGDYDPPLYDPEEDVQNDPQDRYVSDQNDGLRVAGQLPSRDVERAAAASSRQVVEEAWRRVDDGLLFYVDEYDAEEDARLFRHDDRVRDDRAHDLYDLYEDPYDAALRLEKGQDDYGLYSYYSADSYDVYDDVSALSSSRDGDWEPRPSTTPPSTWTQLLDTANAAIESMTSLVTRPQGQQVAGHNQGPQRQQHLVMGAGNRELVLGAREREEEDAGAGWHQRASRRMLHSGH